MSRIEGGEIGVREALLLVPDAGDGRHWRRFREPVGTVVATDPDDVLPALRRIDEATERGLWAVGAIAYEAALGLDPALVTSPPKAELPLLAFGLFPGPGEVSEGPGRPAVSSPDLGWRPEIDRDRHGRMVAEIQSAIAAGHTYQCNATFRLRTEAPISDPKALFARLVNRQPVAHAAFVDLGRWILCSASPELFFRLEGRRITCRPMKGTTPRGRWTEEDIANRDFLVASDKERAENVMITDMVRNDLGILAEPGSVRVSELCRVECYSTVWQMTSTVEASTDCPFSEIVRALFPAASVTGAPKPRSMAILSRLEPSPRGFYTGAVGWVGPDRRAELNVAIRTVTVDRAAGFAEYGTGGGIVWDSDPEREWEETRSKAAILDMAADSVRLLETMLWHPRRGFRFLDEHLRRLEWSAKLLGYSIPLPSELRLRLGELAAGLVARPHRIRLLAARDGTVELEAAPVGEERRRPWRLALARSPVDPKDRRLYHKTSDRRLYEAARAEAPAEADDVVLWNPAGEATETTIGNLVARIDGRLVTPPVAAGLLPGIYRQRLLTRGVVAEAAIPVGHLRRAEEIWVVNSVRGPIRGRLLPTHPDRVVTISNKPSDSDDRGSHPRIRSPMQ